MPVKLSLPVEQFNTALKEFQDKYGPMTLKNVGNFDEFFIDMNDFAGKKAIFVDDTSDAHVIVPYELAPHLTGLWGFSGPKMLDLVIIGLASRESPRRSNTLSSAPGTNPGCFLPSRKTAGSRTNSSGRWSRSGPRATARLLAASPPS